MAGGKVTIKGPNLVKEIILGATMGLAAASMWKMHQWKEQRKARSFNDMLERGEISLTAEE